MSASSSTTRIFVRAFIPVSSWQAVSIPARRGNTTVVKQILVVEPNGDVRALIEIVIRRLGHEPVVYADAGEDVPPVDAAVVEPGVGDGLAIAKHLAARGVP